MSQSKSKVTIYDVADHAGVAISTVSRVLNNSSDVSEATRARVLKAIKILRFRPDRTARSLAQQHNRLIAIAIPTFTVPFHNELLKGVQTCLRSHDLDLLLWDLGSKSPDASLLNFLKRGTVDGLLIANVILDLAVVHELEALKAPVIVVGSSSPYFDSFYWDDIAGAQRAVSHLIGQGHHRIGMIRSDSDSPIQIDRIAGYRAALEEAGFPFDPNLVISGETKKHAGFSEEAGYEAMQVLLELSEPVTAVFASSDAQALGAWKAIIDSGKKVPDDIAIVGYDDIKSSHYLGLSSVDQSMQEIGFEATQLLVERVLKTSNESLISRKVVPKLQVRRSSLKS